MFFLSVTKNMKPWVYSIGGDPFPENLHSGRSTNHFSSAVSWAEFGSKIDQQIAESTKFVHGFDHVQAQHDSFTSKK